MISRPRSGLLGWSAVGLVSCLVLSGALTWSALTGAGTGPTSGMLRLLVTDELADVSGLVTAFSQRSGIAVQVDAVPAAELARRTAAPEFRGRYDAVWIAETGVQPLPGAAEARLENGTTVMSSPLVLGLRTGRAERDLTWADLAAEARAGRFRFGLVRPRAAGAALLEIAAGLADSPETLTPQSVYRISPDLRALSAAQGLIGNDEPELLARLSRAPEIDGVVALESQILRHNAAPADAGSVLRVVAPGGRAVFTHYQLRPVLPPWRRTGSADLRELTAYLSAPPARTWIATHTRRRPGLGAAGPGFADLRPIVVPRSSELVERLSGIYLDQFHYPTRTVFVLDVSGSMRGTGLRRLRHAFGSLRPTIATHHGTDVEILVVPFSAAPRRTRAVVVRAAHPQTGLNRLNRLIGSLRPGGGTAIYAALEQADREIADRAPDGPDQVTSIVLITDGANTTGPGLEHFQRHRCPARTDGCRTPVYPVLVGSADAVAMRALADATGGAVKDARTVDLGRVLQELTTGR